MLILITRYKKIFSENIYLSNIEHGAITSKIMFLSILSRGCMFKYFIVFFSCMHDQYKYRYKCIFKILQFLHCALDVVLMVVVHCLCLSNF